MLLSTLSFRFEVRCWCSYLLSVAPSSDGKGPRTSLGARFLLVLTGKPVVTLSSAGRARISLKHGLGCTKSRRSHLAAAGSILAHFHAQL